MDTFTTNYYNTISIRCIKMKGIVILSLIFLIFSTWNINIQQNIFTSLITNKIYHASSTLNPAMGSSYFQFDGLYLGYSKFPPFHNYTTGETMVYNRGDNLWVFISLRNGSLSLVNKSALVTLINPINEIVLNTTLPVNMPVNVYNFSSSDYLGYWFLTVNLSRLNNTVIKVRILLVDSTQSVSINIKNQSLSIKQGDLTYTVNGTITFNKSISEYQVLLFPIEKSINTTITGRYGEQIRITGSTSITNDIIKINATSSLQFGLQVTLSIERPIILEKYYTSAHLYWYPLIYDFKNDTPSNHHIITITLNNLTINQPLILSINLLDPKSKQVYDSRSFNLIYLRSIGIYSYTADSKVYSQPITNTSFQSDYKGYIHTVYTLVILSRTYGIWSINVNQIFPPFIEIKIIDQFGKSLSNYQLNIINSSFPITTIFYNDTTYIIPKTINRPSNIIFYYNLTIKEYDISVNYYTQRMLKIFREEISLTMRITLHKLTINLYTWGKLPNAPPNVKIQINKFNDGGGIVFPQSSVITFRLPPGQYNIKIFNDEVNWSKNVTLNSDMQINAELYNENPTITFLIVFIGTVIIVSEIILGIMMIKKIRNA